MPSEQHVPKISVELDLLLMGAAQTASGKRRRTNADRTVFLKDLKIIWFVFVLLYCLKQVVY